MASSYEELEKLRQSCIDDGLLTSAAVRATRITKKGRQYVKFNALADEEVRAALEEAVRTTLHLQTEAWDNWID